MAVAFAAETGMTRANAYKLFAEALDTDTIFNVRRKYPDLSEMKADMLAYAKGIGKGVANHTPIKVWNKGGKSIVIFGFCRVEAVRQLNTELKLTGDDRIKILATMFEGDMEEAERLNISENFSRNPVDAFSIAESLKRKLEQFGGDVQKVAQHFGKSDAWVKTHLNIKTATSPEFQDELASNDNISSATAIRATHIAKHAGENEARAVIQDAKAMDPKGRLTEANINRAARKRESLPEGTKNPGMKMSEYKKYVEQTIETEPEDSPVRELYIGIRDFLAGKFGERGMDNRNGKLAEACGYSYGQELTKGKGRK